MPVTINGTTGIAGVDGSNTTPAIKGGTSTGTGVFYGTNTVSLATGGTTAVTVDSSQNVGIGTASPSVKLDVAGVAKCSSDFYTGNNIYLSGGSGSAKFVQIRPPSGYSGYIQFTEDAVADRWSIGCANGDGSFIWKTGASFTGTERARIDSNGYLLVGYTSSNGAYKLQVNSQIFATSATIATSDARYKENIEPITDGLALVNALNPVSFDWKQHPVHAFDTEHKTVGFLAQEVQTAFADKPYVNSIIKESECELPEGTKEKFLGIAEGNMVSILTSAIKELSAKLDAAEARIAALEAK